MYISNQICLKIVLKSGKFKQGCVLDWLSVSADISYPLLDIRITTKFHVGASLFRSCNNLLATWFPPVDSLTSLTLGCASLTACHCRCTSWASKWGGVCSWWPGQGWAGPWRVEDDAGWSRRVDRPHEYGKSTRNLIICVDPFQCEHVVMLT